MKGLITPQTPVRMIKTYVKAEIYRKFHSLGRKNFTTKSVFEYPFRDIPIKWQKSKKKFPLLSRNFFKNNYFYTNLDFIEKLNEKQVDDLINISKLAKRLYLSPVKVFAEKKRKEKNRQTEEEEELETKKKKRKIIEKNSIFYVLTDLDVDIVNISHSVKKDNKILNLINFTNNYKTKFKVHQIKIIDYILKDIIYDNHINFRMSFAEIEMIIIGELMSLIVQYNRSKILKPKKIFRPEVILQYTDTTFLNWFKPQYSNDFSSDYLEISYVLWPCGLRPMLRENKSYIVPFLTITTPEYDDPDIFDDSVPLVDKDIIALPLLDDGSYDFNWPKPILLNDNTLGIRIEDEKWLTIIPFFQANLDRITIKEEPCESIPDIGIEENP
jgi:hypothetical protein